MRVIYCAAFLHVIPQETPFLMTLQPPSTDDLRIVSIKDVSTAGTVIAEIPITSSAATVVENARADIHRVFANEDDRLVVITGPCSIHDPQAALEYARKLQALVDSYQDDLILVMRVYFEKPRTTVGWKGLINDPNIDESFDINKGLRVARRLLLEINDLGLPAGTEFLDILTPQYLADLVSWGAIGARTTESQLHRELASGLSCPVGFKNGTDGNLKIAVDAVGAAIHSHHFLSITKDGRSAIFETRGNQDGHLILRGGKEPNHDPDSVEAAASLMAKGGLSPKLIVDCSHANSGKDPSRQPEVIDSVCAQVSAGDDRIKGVMIESHLQGGRQDVIPGQPLTYGQSITDACIAWEETVPLLERLSQAVQSRRRAS